LSTELQNALQDISGSTEASVNEDMTVDGVDFGHDFGTAPDDDHSDVEGSAVSQGIIIDIRDVVGLKRWHGRRKYRAQSRKERIHRFNEAWASIIDELVDDFIQWKYKIPLAQSPPSPIAELSEWDFSIDTVDLYTLTHKTTICRDKDTKATSALVRAGYLAASPVSPSLAISLRTLELLRTIRLFKPNFSIEAFAKTVCHLYAVRNPFSYPQVITETLPDTIPPRITNCFFRYL